VDLFSLTKLRRAALGLSALGLAAVAARYALRGLDWPSFQAQIQKLDWRWLLIAVLFDISSYAAQGVRWRFLLEGSSVWHTTRAIYAGLFLNELIPLRPGEAVRAWLAARDFKVGLLSVVPTMLVERLMDGFWLFTALLAMLSFAPLPNYLVHVARLLIASIGALLIVAWLLGRTRFELVRKVRSGLSNGPALLASGCFLLAQGLAFWAVIRASHLSLGLVAAFVVMVVVRIGTLIPGAPANLGTHQFSTVLGLSLYGVPQHQAAAFSLVVFTVLTAPLLAIGFAACLSAGLTWGSIRQVSGPGATAVSA
jgi:glycosyltransferase 2 family protein